MVFFLKFAFVELKWWKYRKDKERTSNEKEKKQNWNDGNNVATN